MREIRPVALASLAILLVEHCTTVTLTRYVSQRVDAPRPASSVAVLVTELLKALLSVALELTACGGLGTRSSPGEMVTSVLGRRTELLRVSVPALLYTVQNNLVYVALGCLEMVTFQVLYQVKLLLTALLAVFFLGQRLSAQRWFALLVLTAGVIIVELSTSDTPPPPPPKPPLPHRRGRHAPASLDLGRSSCYNVGAAAALVSAALSSSAGVYFEAVLKKEEEGRAVSLWARNLQLSVASIPLAALAVVAQWRPRHSSIRSHGLFAGFDAPLLALVLLNAAGGLVVAAVIKYGDNILKNFSTACSVILGTLLSVVLFDFRPGLQFVGGGALVAAATVIYAFGSPGARPPWQQKATAEADASSDEGERAPMVSTRSEGGNSPKGSRSLRPPADPLIAESRNYQQGVHPAGGVAV